MAAAALRAIGEEAGSRGATAAANPKFLFELIVADLHWSSLQIGSLALMASVAAQAGSKSELHTCRHLVYDDTRVMRLALRYGAEAGLGEEVRRKFDQLYADIGVALKQMGPFCQPNSLAAGQRDQLARVVPVLRRTAQSATECLTLLEGATRSRLNSDYCEDSLVIRQFLGRAARGDCADIDSRGVLIAPRLKQRRQSPRAPVNRPCRLALPAGEFPAEIVDVSREGLGLVCKGPVSQGDTVTVIVGERRLDAKVMRLSGYQAGLALKTPLPVGDPLFMGG